MHILVLGATGPSGISFVSSALLQNHHLTIYARNPAKLPSSASTNPNVTIIKGTFSDTPAISQALNSGATILVSFAGPAVPNKGTPVTEFYQKLFPMLKNSPIRRVLCCSTPSFKVPQDKASWKWWFLVLSIWLVGGSAYDEVNGIGRAVTSLDGLEWTVFRVPALTNGPAKPVRAGFIGEGQDNITLSRKSLAVWILQEIEARKWIGKCPALCNPGWI